MGILDDAIREHLDLKRRRGADPGEVERDEREALGPVKRNQQAAPGAVEDSPEPDGGFAYDQAEEDDWAFDGEGEIRSPGPSGADAEDKTFGYDDAEVDDELEPLPEDPGSHQPDLRGATVEYDVQAELRPPSDPESDEDVLEETPEFLQDTPDHDRLWFEQRPPKDFDFDG